MPHEEAAFFYYALKQQFGYGKDGVATRIKLRTTHCKQVYNGMPDIQKEINRLK